MRDTAVSVRATAVSVRTTAVSVRATALSIRGCSYALINLSFRILLTVRRVLTGHGMLEGPPYTRPGPSIARRINKPAPHSRTTSVLGYGPDTTLVLRHGPGR